MKWTKWSCSGLTIVAMELVEDTNEVDVQSEGFIFDDWTIRGQNRFGSRQKKEEEIVVHRTW